ncbi:hypothetical protein PRNO82_01987 [Planktothrix rubescens]|nr:hypothetical protein PRNO82_01987 [Planktothrix rubescens]
MLAKVCTWLDFLLLYEFVKIFIIEYKAKTESPKKISALGVWKLV